jgi:hypothetical protein
MSEKTKENREKLHKLSLIAKEMQTTYILNGLEPPNINFLIVENMYKKDDKELIFNTFNEWKEQGFYVKKGEKAYLIWSRPVDNLKEEEKTEEDKQNKTGKFFAVSYIFSSKQVAKMESNEN